MFVHCCFHWHSSGSFPVDSHQEHETDLYATHIDLCDFLQCSVSILISGIGEITVTASDISQA